MSQINISGRPFSQIVLLAVLLALSGGLLALVAALGTRLGLWSFSTGFTLLRWAAYGSLASLPVALAGLWVSRPAGPRYGFSWALLALVVGGVVAAIPANYLYQARQVPAIHDITTDTLNPPQFHALSQARRDAPNRLEYPGAEFARQQQRAYPDIKPLQVPLEAEEVFDAALAAARQMGWEVVAARPQQGRIEAVATTFWFGFKDDVVIRLKPQGAGIQVDVRSASRVGRSDVGKNAERIRAYLDRLRQQLPDGGQ